jgi:hypothetical protein
MLVETEIMHMQTVCICTPFLYVAHPATVWQLEYEAHPIRVLREAHRCNSKLYVSKILCSSPVHASVDAWFDAWFFRNCEIRRPISARLVWPLS